MRKRLTNQPLTNPIAIEIRIASTKPTSSDVRPALKNVHMTIAAKPKVEPTERSISPAANSIVMPRAIMPSSGVKASRLLMLVGERNEGGMEKNGSVLARRDVRKLKTRISTISSTRGPNSGAATNLLSGGAEIAFCRREDASINCLDIQSTTDRKRG